MNRHIGGISTTPVKECNDKQLVAQYTFSSNMIEHTTQSLKFISGLLQSSVVHNIAFRGILLFCFLLAHYTLKTFCHRQVKNTPIHFATHQQAVKAVLAGFQYTIELAGVHRGYGLPKDTEYHH